MTRIEIMTAVRRTAALLALLWFAAAAPAAAQAGNESPSGTAGTAAPGDRCVNEAAWVGFRGFHPAPYQAIAVRRDGDEAVIIISEPPPSVARTDLLREVRDAFGDDLIGIRQCSLPTGLDGWLEDLVLRVRLGREPDVEVMSGELRPWRVPAALADRLRLLHGVLYGTMDGFWLDDLAAASPAAPIGELRIPPSMLHGWLTGAGPEWRSLAPSEERIAASRLQHATAPGAFGRADGLVAFVAPQGSRLEDLEAHFRRFAVASDLLLGAARKGSHGPLVLIGRARRLPLSQLPPLRFETFASLARNTEGDLAQSYERRRIFAGRLQSGEHVDWDWAPILLSAQLDDSEFGTLLNQADQLLKSWSEVGEVAYHSFHYPTPRPYPVPTAPVPIAASEYFRQRHGTSSLVFNWNTEDFGTIVQFPTVETLTIDRTNALPILYLPADVLFAPIEGAEEEPAPQIRPAEARRRESAAQADARGLAVRARNGFASLGDPILVRVAQNVLLAQAIRNFLRVADRPVTATSARSDSVAQAIQQQAVIWLRDVNGANSTVATELRAEIQRLLRSRTIEELAEIIAIPQRAEQLAIRDRRRLDRLVARHADAVRDFNAIDRGGPGLEAEIERMNNQYEAGIRQWRNICTSSNGRIQEGRTLVCTGSSRGADLDAQENRVKALEPQLNRLNDNLRALNRRRDEAGTQMTGAYEAVRSQHNRLNRNLEGLQRIVELGNALQAYSGGADLNVVLQSVTAATASPPQGWIRTPSVVLSQNESRQEMIGGHNIGLTPARGRAATRIERPRRVSGGGAIEAEAPVAQADRIPALIMGEDAAAPTARAAATPLDPGRGTLLDEMRAVGRGQAAQPAAQSEALAAARGCQCDVYVRQLPDGTIQMVRNRPPPSVQQVSAKSALIDALAGPPPPSRIEFENFPRETVESITDTIDRLGRSGRAGGWGRRIDDLASTPPRDGQRPTLLVVGRNRRRELLEVSPHPAAREALASPVNARGATAELAPDGAWPAAYGADAAGQGSRILVQFPSLPNGRVASIGIRVRSAAADVSRRLLARIRAWLGARPPGPASLDDVLLGLRETIRQELGGPGARDIEFYFSEGSQVIRVAISAHRAAANAG